MKGKKIVLGVSGGIAAYKSVFLLRLLKKAGAEVKVIMTESAKEFVGTLTFATLSENAVLSDFYNKESGVWENHVEIGLWADLIVVAPTTANTLAQFANGICNNLLTAVYLSAKCKTMIAPAMDLDMYLHPSTKNNLEKLQNFGNIIIPAESGALASGLSGQGRLAEPETIFELIDDFFNAKKYQNIKGKTILVTAGPTYEAIDPVRFIGNHSSGKMGIMIAEFLAVNGAKKVNLVCGPSSYQNENYPNLNRINVTSAAEMFEVVKEIFSESDITIAAAAVADYSPSNPSDTKIKKKTDKLTIDLQPTVDILAHLGKNKKSEQILVGFALETDNEEANAKAKIEKKNLDFIVLNSLKDEGAGFKHDTNKISIIEKNNKKTSFELKDKKKVAKDIVEYLNNYLSK
jgi:phosphopantothenoylcysteine decarboxylase / phosphopantothenate---cysteine ligase